MYCENCQFEIKDNDETQCPLCGGPLVASSGAQAASDTGVTLDLNDSPEGAFVLDDEEDMQPQGQAVQEPPEEYDNRGTGLDLSGIEAPSGIAFSDNTDEILDQALQEFDPMVDEHYTKKKKSKSSTILLLVLLLVCALGAGGYYYFFMMGDKAAPEPAPAPVVAFKKKAPAEKPVVPQAPAETAAVPAQQPAPVKPAQETKTEAPAAPAVQQPETKPAEAAAAAKKPEPAKPAAETKPEARPAAETPQAVTKPAEAPAVAKAPEKPAAPAPEPAAKPQHVAAVPPAAPPVQPAAQPAVKPAPVVEAIKPVEQKQAPAEMPAAKAGKPVFSVMTDSLHNPKNADAEMQRLRKLGYDARIMEINLGKKGTFYHLIGAWANRADAQQMANEVRSKLGKKGASVMPVVQ